MHNQKCMQMESRFWDLAKILCWLMQSKLFQFCLIQCEWRMTHFYKCRGSLQMFIVQREWSTVNEDCMHLFMWKWVVSSYRLCDCYDSGFMRYNNDWVYKFIHALFLYPIYFLLFIWKVLNCIHVYELVWNYVFMYWK